MTKLPWSPKNTITKNKNIEKVSHLEIKEVVLVHCNIVNNIYQQDSSVLRTFASNISLNQLFNISPKPLIFLKILASGYLKMWLIDQNIKPLHVDHKIIKCKI